MVETIRELKTHTQPNTSGNFTVSIASVYQYTSASLPKFWEIVKRREREGLAAVILYHNEHYEFTKNALTVDDSLLVKPFPEDVYQEWKDEGMSLDFIKKEEDRRSLKAYSYQTCCWDHMLELVKEILSETENYYIWYILNQEGEKIYFPKLYLTKHPGSTRSGNDSKYNDIVNLLKTLPNKNMLD